MLSDISFQKEISQALTAIWLCHSIQLSHYSSKASVDDASQMGMAVSQRRFICKNRLWPDLAHKLVFADRPQLQTARIYSSSSLSQGRRSKPPATPGTAESAEQLCALLFVYTHL